jgi:broad specificity phosphatase PhoE
MLLDLVFVRHGISCANALSHKSYGAHLLYPDPELTKEGVSVSKGLSAVLIKYLGLRWGREPYSVGASRMIRAQETAYHMIASTFGLPINIIAHVGESGLSRDNFSLTTEEQVKLLFERSPAMVDLLLKGRDGREPQNIWDKSNFDKFLKWAALHPEFFSLGSDGRYRAVIFTHSHFLKHAFNMPHMLANNDAIHTIIDTDKVGTGSFRLRYETWTINRENPTYMCPDGCKITACPTTSEEGGGALGYEHYY